MSGLDDGDGYDAPLEYMQAVVAVMEDLQQSSSTDPGVHSIVAIVTSRA
jgi:hypothetical protein